jgi:hypothetical protein
MTGLGHWPKIRKGRDGREIAESCAPHAIAAWHLEAGFGAEAANVSRRSVANSGPGGDQEVQEPPVLAGAHQQDARKRR